MKLQEKLHRLREENGISQINLAEKLEVSRQTISRWEAGTSVPATENLMRLSVLYGVPLDEWVKEDWTPSSAPGRGCGRGNKIKARPEEKTRFADCAASGRRSHSRGTALYQATECFCEHG